MPMRKLRFHPCGNFKEHYGQELDHLRDRFRETLGRHRDSCVLFGVVPFIASPYLLYVLNMIGHRGHCSPRASTSSSGSRDRSHWDMALSSASAPMRRASSPRTFGMPFLGCRSCGRARHGRRRHDLRHPLGPTERPLPDHCDPGRPVHHRVRPRPLGKPDQGDHGDHASRGDASSGSRSTADLRFFYVIFVSLTVMILGAVEPHAHSLRQGLHRDPRQRPGRRRAWASPSSATSSSPSPSVPFMPALPGLSGPTTCASITTEPFTLGLSVEYIAMVIIGGLGSIPGLDLRRRLHHAAQRGASAARRTP